MKYSRQLVDNAICIVLLLVCWLIGLYLAMGA